VFSFAAASTTGQIVAALMDAEAARITSGASAAITLAAATCVVGTYPMRVEQLPDTTGMRNRVLIQPRHMYKYAPMVRLSCAKLTEVGDDGGTTADQLAETLEADTAGVFFPAHLEGMDGTRPLADVLRL
jgi:L-seryl-tRNA(Ser) seleniumtransferase